MMRSGSFATVVLSVRLIEDGEPIRYEARCLYSGEGGLGQPAMFFARNFWFVFGGIFFVVGFALFVGGFNAWQTEQRFDANATRAKGTVLTRDIETARRSSGDGASTKYRVTYRFDARSGETLEHSDDVDVHRWESLHEQGPVDIEYLRDEPQVSRIAGESDRLTAWILMGIGGPFGLFGGGVLIFAIRRRMEANRLRRDGAHTTGTVVAVKETNISINRVRQWRIQYSYRDHRGHTHEDESDLISPDAASQIEAAQAAPVRYDRNAPEKSLWLGPPDN